jgi:hypothetical protein
LAEGQITTADPELADRFTQYLAQEGVIEAASEPEEAASEQPPVQEEIPETPAPEAEPEEAPEPEAEPEASPEGEEEPEVAAASEDPGIQNFSDLATAFEIEESELLDHLQVESRDGEGTVSVAEVLNAYHSAPENSEIEKRKYEELSQQVLQERDGKLGELQKLTASLIAHMESDPKVDWDELREADPGRYLREKETREAKETDVRRALDEMQAEQSSREEDEGKRHEAWRTEQVESLYRMRPDWKEAESARDAMTEIQDYLVKSGFTPDQIESLEDANSILTVWRAAQWEKLQAKKPETKKRLRLLPRTLRSTARDDAANVSSEKVEQEEGERLRQNLKNSGSVEDAAALMEGYL